MGLSLSFEKVFGQNLQGSAHSLRGDPPSGASSAAGLTIRLNDSKPGVREVAQAVKSHLRVGKKGSHALA